MSELESAYGLLREFKGRKIPEGRILSADELHLVNILAADLLPNRKFDSVNFHEIIYAIATADTKWNFSLAETLDNFYREIGAGKVDDGVGVLKTFLNSCPSQWYRSIAEIELNNLDS